MLLDGCATPFFMGDGGLRLEEPVELAIVEESLPFLTTLAFLFGGREGGSLLL